TACGAEPHRVALPVLAVPHKVQYESEVGLYFCDVAIEMHPKGAHGSVAEMDKTMPLFPFVRLAVARYQPHSIPARALSDPVLTERCQLAPYRKATVSLVSGAEPGTVAVSVLGPRIPNGPNQGGLRGSDGHYSLEPKYEIALQKRVAGTKGNAGWETTP